MALVVPSKCGNCFGKDRSLIPANPAVGQELSAVPSLLPYETRYCLYREWEKDDECNPMVLSAKQTAKTIIEDGEVQCAKGDSSRIFRWWEESIYRHMNNMTIATVVIIAEILKNNGFAVEKTVNDLHIVQWSHGGSFGLIITMIQITDVKKP
ncbi:hypothetical protein L1987_18639 [Smallanthus sonchifolius]|uniref:Uncharacterized protein n=1 Tax=Smallanthus sonchifolius TaxID=185202 RepID=A0ACB9J148_9ASTR|nr:hypothetical protein L1987_18639 [Smallanthus sonchifolius]